METEEKKIRITEMNEEALFVDGFGKALVGYARRCGQPTLAVYDAGKCIEMIEMGLSRDKADRALRVQCGGCLGRGPHPNLHVRFRG